MIKAFTRQDMEDFAYFYHNWFTNAKRPDVEDAIPIWVLFEQGKKK